MCVAVLVESDAPTASELAMMELDNPHGAGIAYAKGNAIHYRKGLKWGQIHALAKSLPRPFLMHFRWATHGPRVARLTHPFPLGYKAITSSSLRGKAKAVLIHNGTWGDAYKKAPDWIKAYPETSDTGIAALLADWNEDILDDVRWATAVGRAAGNGRMDVTLRGTWEEYNGNLYSNLNWQPRNRYYAHDYYPRSRGWSYSSSFEEWCADKEERREMIADAMRGMNYRRTTGGAWVTDPWPEEHQGVSTEGPIGMIEIPEETPQEVRDQLMLELTPEERQQADDDAAKIGLFLDEMFPDHAEVQRALQKMEAENPSRCPTEGCVQGNHATGRCLSISGKLLAFKKPDGTVIKRKPEVTWREDGKMVHLRPRGEGCE